ncbi:MAG: LPS export ABC transporter periplasmic protein LptC [Sphingobacteriales bacterium]|nr:MAG: LPS export ABC transporter periplasmic protein LptC [Sphingobacteriales bacterium]TAF80596.1 MAG: LPS export ABC transporter periplasmic protein LptC [Sphingobacteriales bacterium]
MYARLLFYVAVLSFILQSCKNDISHLKAVKLKRKITTETTLEAEMIYSDSAKVKAKLNAPILLNNKTDTPYYEMPKGMQVIFYDDSLKQSSKVTSNYAITRDNQKRLELRNNVVAANNKGETFKSEELTWDQNKRIFFSNKVVHIATKSAEISGTKFWAKEDFSYYEIKQGAGPLTFKDDITAN